MSPVINADRAKVIVAPKSLKRDEAAIFTKTATLHRHLTAADETLLTAFAMAAAKTARLARHDDPDSVVAWDKSFRAMMLAARSLRITQQAMSHHEKVARVRANAPPTDLPWEKPFDRSEIDDD